MKVFVTGATGFIGRRLVDRLIEDGNDIVALIRSRDHGLPAGVATVEGDITYPESLAGSMKGCGRLFHLASFVSFDPGTSDQLMKVNGDGTANVLRAAQKDGVERALVASSACTFGLSPSANIVLDEDSPLDASLAERNSYMASKLAAEKVAFDASGEFHVVTVNPTTVYGPGDASLNSGALVVKVAKSMAVPVPSGGSNVVDVDDVVEGMMAAVERGASGQRYALGGWNLTFSEICKTVSRVVDKTPLFVPLPNMLGAPVAMAAGLAGRITGNRLVTRQIIRDMFSFKYYSSARAKKDLGWEAKRTFAESAARAWKFYKDNGLA